ncbi:MAG: ABC transporter permease [Candidatus Rokubacteria bacterium]|nr:ABC transporter permease [Candidatus Rokubacteria bacterium]MBI2490802.1 ABC transporter permease [Candidatus Rokubacteria bacterium]MBI4628355.1 ABC transporter permease [Candidatus Rokubacteria bacterium]
MNVRRLAPWLLVAAPLAVFVALFLAPLVNLFALSLFRFDRSVGVVGGLTVENYTKFLGDPFYLGILWRTLRIGVLATLASLLLGYPLAYHMQRCRPRARAYLALLVLAPLLVSVVVRSFGWLVILGPNGLVNSLLVSSGIVRDPLRLLYTEGAIVVGLTHVFLSFMVLSIAAALARIDPALLRAAQNLGATERQTFFRVVLPLSLPGVAAGSLIVFTLSSSAFITPALLGGPRVKVMSYLSYQQTLLLSDWPYGAAIAFVLLGLVAGAVLVYLRVLESGRYGVVFR